MATSLTSAFSPEILRQHGLTPDEYEKIKQLLGGREPTLTELGIFSVMWSEHCSYKSSRVHLKRLPTRSKLRVARARERMRASSTLGTGGLARSRSSRTIIRHSSSRFRVRRPASAEFCATFLPWARGPLR